jgi:hypothetical protein
MSMSDSDINTPDDRTGDLQEETVQKSLRLSFGRPLSKTPSQGGGQPSTTDENLSRAEKFAKSREEYKQKAKERVKSAKKSYLARPEVQEKLRLQKQKFADYRKEKSAALKSSKKAEKVALSSAEKSTRQRRQEERDAELCTMLDSASKLKPTLKIVPGSASKDSGDFLDERSQPQETPENKVRKPKFTVIHCERK